MSSDFRCENNTEIISSVNSQKYCCTCSRTKRRNFVVPSVAPLQQTSFFTLSNIQLKILILVLKKPALAIDHFLYFTDVEGNILHIITAFNSGVSIHTLRDCSSTTRDYGLHLLQPVTGTFLHPTNSLVNLNTTNHVKFRQQKSPELPGLMHYIDYY